ncbi:MAG: pyridoxal phosphate-dependent aminotransferase [Clostridia bacterium]|nr:pyridoxal phosphate-dependent aminotransferase [Clostridia bacterium]
MKKNGLSVISFSVGEPDFKTPVFIINACKEALDKGVTKYTPVGGTAELKRAICDKFRRDNSLEYEPDNIVVSTGAKSSLFHALYAILNPDDEVIIPKPFWITYSEIVGICGARSVFAETREENGYKITAEEFESLITPSTKCIIINSPNNPSGSVYSEAELRKIAEVAVKHDVFVISDEVYERLVFDGTKHVSIASFGEDIKKITIVINAVSKTYAMTGWRIGYLACDKSIAKVITALQSHTTSNATSFAQYGATAAINYGEETVEEMIAVFAHRRQLIIDLLSETEGVRFNVPLGAFYVFVDVSAYYGRKFRGKIIGNSVDFCSALLDFGVAAVPGAPFGNDKCIRLSYATSEENIHAGIARLNNFLKEFE